MSYSIIYPLLVPTINLLYSSEIIAFDGTSLIINNLKYIYLTYSMLKKNKQL